MEFMRNCSLIVAASLAVLASSSSASIADDQAASTLLAEFLEQLDSNGANAPERGVLRQQSFVTFPSISRTTYETNRHLSLLITDVDIVKEIRFSSFFDKLISSHHSRRGDPLQTREALFHQLWDTANKNPGLIEPVVTPHCDDKPKAGSTLPFNGFNFDCPRYEGDLANGFKDPFTDNGDASPFSNNAAGKIFDDSVPYDAKNISKNSYSAVAISNRFDLLSPPEPARRGRVVYPDCGEVRVIYARNSGVSVGQNNGTMILGDRFERNLIAFEARIPNPDKTPQSAKDFPKGCAPLVRFFHELSNTALTNAIRGKLLSALVFKGRIERYRNNQFVLVSKLTRPVADFRNFLLKEKYAGQIRTDQFLNKRTTTIIPAPPPPSIYDPPGAPTTQTQMKPQQWLLRELRLDRQDGTLIAVPDTVKSTVAREILAATAPLAADTIDNARALLKDVIGQAGRLAGGTDEQGVYSNGSDVGLISFPTLTRSATPFESNSSTKARGDIVDGYNNGLAKEPSFTTPLSDGLGALNPKLKGGELTAANVIDRLRTQSCAGCHQYSDTKIEASINNVKVEFGFDPPGSLGLGAVWPNKACGDISPKDCSAGIDLSVGAGNATKNELKPNQHPPMPFTHISELILTRSVGDSNKGWRYSISTTAECLLNARESFFRKIVNEGKNPNPAPCAPGP